MTDGLAGGLSGWSLAWSEEFEGAAGSAPDPGTWQAEVGGHGWGNEELQYYTDAADNAALDGAGNLAIVVRRVDPQSAGRFDGRRYTSARLISKDRVTFTHGLVQARIRLPRGRGIWPAFWLLGQDIDDVGWPGCGEIDVMENFGDDPTVVHGTVHGPGYSGAAGITASYRAGASLSETFHLYSVRWEADSIRWFLDGHLYGTVRPGDMRGKPWVFDHAFYLLLNVAVGGAFSVDPDPSGVFPATMLVDFIRVYAASPAPAAGRPAGLSPPGRS